MHRLNTSDSRDHDSSKYTYNGVNYMVKKENLDFSRSAKNVSSPPLFPAFGNLGEAQ